MMLSVLTAYRGGGILSFLLVGLIAGWLAGKISKGRGFGVLGNLAIGMIGALVGGLLFSLLGIAAYGFVGSLVMATIGALFLLYVVRSMK
jgi:uncharacterized membrane protein YeaQ/YmgE (transglycosylase-associated protein family)